MSTTVLAYSPVTAHLARPPVDSLSMIVPGIYQGQNISRLELARSNLPAQFETKAAIMISKQIRLLFLTTQDPTTIKAEWPFYQNWTLSKRMIELGAAVEMLCWRDSSVTIEQLVRFDKICFLWCNNYHAHGMEFERFLKEKLKPAKEQARVMEVLNDVDFILWNMDKATYLPELKQMGFLLPGTAHVDISSLDSVDGMINELRRASSIVGSKIVLKPAISGSSKLTHLVQDIEQLSSADIQYMEALFDTGLDGSLIVQAFEPAIGDGEYSLVFIGGEHTHTMLKTPRKGEFKCQAEFGGGIAELASADVPEIAVATAQNIVQWLGEKFQLEVVPYCRIDGVIREGQFVLMEVEAIEPHLWLETCSNHTASEKLYDILLR